MKLARGPREASADTVGDEKYAYCSISQAHTDQRLIH